MKCFIPCLCVPPVCALVCHWPPPRQDHPLGPDAFMPLVLSSFYPPLSRWSPLPQHSVGGREGQAEGRFGGDLKINNQKPRPPFESAWSATFCNPCLLCENLVVLGGFGGGRKVGKEGRREGQADCHHSTPPPTSIGSAFLSCSSSWFSISLSSKPKQITTHAPSSAPSRSSITTEPVATDFTNKTQALTFLSENSGRVNTDGVLACRRTDHLLYNTSLGGAGLVTDARGLRIVQDNIGGSVCDINSQIATGHLLTRFYLHAWATHLFIHMRPTVELGRV